jgi:hypothetical protein
MHAQPQHHVTYYKRSDHAECPYGHKKGTCGDLLPSLFDVPNMGLGRKSQSDSNQFGCAGCDAQAVVSVLLCKGPS